jgi:hypothetical protein
MTTDSRRALGYGLLAGAAGITLLMLVWLATSGAQGGGIVLGLLLVFVLAGPLAGAGWYALSRARGEAAEERAFANQRRIREADRLFRAELAVQLNQLASMPGLPRERIQRMTDQLEQTGKDEVAWYDTVQLDDAQAGVLRQYDDLVWQRLRWLRDHAHEDGAIISEAMSDLQRALDQRSDLLTRGRQAPSVAPAALLRASAPTHDLATVQAVGVRDAVTHAGVDYVVEGAASAFADGQTWRLVHLVPSGSGATEHWLLVSPGGLELSWLDRIPEPKTGTAELQLEGATLPLESTASATVRITSQAGSAEGVPVSVWRYRSGSTVGLVQQWPDGTVDAYAGKVLKPADLEVWPAASTVPNA